MTIKINCKPPLLLVTLLPLAPLALVQCTGHDDAEVMMETSTSEATGSTGGEEPVPTTGSTMASDDSGPETSTSTTDSGDRSTTDSMTTAPVEPTCGDGIVQGVEECDEGIVENMLSGFCLPTCLKARCGDGFVQVGVEECDFGEVANSIEYGGCLPMTCKWGARCGDGDLDVPNEVCDPGDPNNQGGETADCAADCRFLGRLVFLSSIAYTGNLGGLAGADAQCRDLAAAFDTAHADRYIAWLSDAKTSPLQRVAHGAEYTDTPYVLRSGVPVADDFEDLVENGPWPGIDITDKYESVANVQVWTNTTVDGSGFSAQNHCEEWGSDSKQHSARTGKNWLPADSMDLEAWQQFGQWTSWKPMTCEGKFRIYCLEN